MNRKKITFWLDERQIQKLKNLSSATRIRQADFAREAFADLFQKYEKELKEAKRSRKKEGGEGRGKAPPGQA